MNIGDKVVTKHGEEGILEKRWDHNDSSYDWWIRINFTFEGKDYITTEPWKEKELKKVND